ncbi:MAG: cytochrome c family protein [Fidelibacterota bacterium]|nr:MAG: cytochrome c family protein [Candidatus Neomarinimicrobiota bacterium]
MTRVLVVILVFSLTALTAGEGDYSYVGVNTCKMCHKKAEKGDQFGIWSKGKHANAFETLKSDEAVAIAKEKGIEGAPSEAGECLVCHATGWGKPGGYEVLSAEFIADEANAKVVKKNNTKANVGCESCHGAGSGYKSKKTMEGIYNGEIEGASVGLWTPAEEVCTTCHNEKSPTYKEFDFEAMVAKIAHPYPE